MKLLFYLWNSILHLLLKISSFCFYLRKKREFRKSGNGSLSYRIVVSDFCYSSKCIFAAWDQEPCAGDRQVDKRWRNSSHKASCSLSKVATNCTLLPSNAIFYFQSARRSSSSSAHCQSLESFRVSASNLWNSLPSKVQFAPPSLAVFGTKLNAFLFRCSFPGLLVWLQITACYGRVYFASFTPSFVDYELPLEQF